MKYYRILLFALLVLHTITSIIITDPTNLLLKPDPADNKRSIFQLFIIYYFRGVT